MQEKKWYELFEFGILIKTIVGSLEIISGLLVLFINKTTIIHLFTYFTASELLEDPNDKLIHFFSGQLYNLTTGMQIFAALYILFHGIINATLAICLHLKKLWAYPLALATSVIFIFYQFYRYNYSHAPGLLIITIFDLAYIVLIFHEYRYRLHKTNNA